MHRRVASMAAGGDPVASNGPAAGLNHHTRLSAQAAEDGPGAHRGAPAMVLAAILLSIPQTTHRTFIASHVTFTRNCQRRSVCGLALICSSVPGSVL